jgi:peroxiredoxin Q/BCP
MARTLALLLLVDLAGCMPRPPSPAAIEPAPPDDAPGAISEGSTLPAASALGTDGKAVSLDSFHSRLVVVYFYPLDFASGATAEAQEFRDDQSKYRKLGATVVGVSTDEPRTHREFAAKLKLPYPLLSDPRGELAGAFGIPLRGGTTRHATFIVDRKGVVRKAWPHVRPWGHSAEVLAALRTIK